MGRIGKNIDAEELRKSYEEIGNVKKLAKFFHTSNNRMLKLLVDNGIEMKKKGNKIILQKSVINSIVKDYTVHNMTMKEICEKYNLKVDKIRDIFKENGVSAYKWHGHIKQNGTTKIGIIKKIALILDKYGIDYEFNFKVTTNLVVGLMSNGVCIDAYKNKYLIDSIADNKRLMLLNRYNKCVEKGYKYIQVFEDEYKDNLDIVLSKIKHQLGVEENISKIPGRKCIIKQITKDDAEVFLNENHIQGFVGSTVHIGAFYNEKLIGVMSFLDEHNGYWNLTRFASLNGYICQGVGGKLFKYFIKNHNPKLIRSFADKRWTANVNNNIYIKLGFKYEYSTKPGYHYCNGVSYKRVRRERFRKQILISKHNLSSDMTELEMAHELGYGRIWDCGLFKYVWTNPDNETTTETVITD